MARQGWYGENRNRAYPFLEGTVGRPDSGPLTLLNLADDVVVDAGFVLGPQSRFATGHTVHLARVRRSGGTFTLEFESDAPELFGVPLAFTRRAGGPDYEAEFADSGQAGMSDSSRSGSDSSSFCAEPLWGGFLVTGAAAALELLLPANGTVERGNGGAVVEPALLQNLAGAYVTSVALANDDRTRVEAPAGCDDVVFPYDTGAVRVRARCLRGALLVKPGYNAAVRQNAQANSLTFYAAVGAGEGRPCAEVPLFDAEVPPEGSGLLAGGPRCNETLRSINGVGGRQFSLSAGPGVTVTAVPEEHKVVVSVDMSGLALCYDVSQVSESC
jgi:hypothetical protein